MKRAFGSRGRSMGTVREVGRAVGGSSSSTTATTRPINNKGTHNSLTLTQPPLSSSCYLSCCNGGGSSSVSPFVCHSSDSNGEVDWVYVHGGEEEVLSPKTRGFEGFSLGPVPSEDEVEEAISALKHAANSSSFMRLSKGQSSYASNENVVDQSATDEMDMVPSLASELDWIEPSFVFNYLKALQPHGAERVYEAFHLLQTEPLIQRIVFSLSTDRAVWEAVLNNEVVRELRDSSAAEGDTREGSDRGPGSTKSILKQMLDNFTAKIISLAEKLRKLVNEVILQSPKKETTGGAALLGEKLISSVMLSVIVLLIVVVTRASRA